MLCLCAFLFATEAFKIYHALRDSLQSPLRNVCESVRVGLCRGGYGVLDIHQDLRAVQFLSDDGQLLSRYCSQNTGEQLFRDSHEHFQIAPASGDFSDAAFKLSGEFIERADYSIQFSCGEVFSLGEMESSFSIFVWGSG